MLVASDRKVRSLLGVPLRTPPDACAGPACLPLQLLCFCFAALVACGHAQTPGQSSAPVPDLATLQAQLLALQTAVRPPSCGGSSFLQFNVTTAGWTCTDSTLLSQTSTYASLPPDCRPPGGAHLLYNKQAGWLCSCNAGWSGPSCANVTDSSVARYPLDTMQWLVGQMQLLSAQMAVLTSMLPANANGLYTVGMSCGPPGGISSQIVNGMYVCLCSPGWSGNLCDMPPRSLVTVAGTPGRYEQGGVYMSCYFSGSNCADHANSAALNDGVGLAAHFKNPGRLALDPTGTWLAIADTDNNAIRKLVLATGAVSTLAGNGTQGSADGAASAASFSAPIGVAVASSGAVYVSDTYNHVIRVITNGVVSTLAGSAPSTGYIDASGSAARLNYPRGIALSADGSVLYVADNSNNVIRAVSTATGAVTTMAGSGNGAFLDGPVLRAAFYGPIDVSLDPASGTLFVSDQSNSRIRAINITAGIVRTIAGNGASGFLDGLSSMAFLSGPQLVQFDPTTGKVLFFDNNRIRSVDPSSGLVATVATGQASNNFAIDGDALSVAFKAGGLAVDSSGNVYISDGFNLIRKLLFSGAPALPLASSAQCSSPGTMYMLNYATIWSCVCKPYWAGSTCQLAPRPVNFLAGSYTYSSYYYGGVQFADGVGTNAVFKSPISALAYTSSGLLLVDAISLRKISFAGSVTTIAGSQTATCTWNGGTFFIPGTGAAACFDSPRGIAVSPDGTIAYVASNGAHIITKVTLATGSMEPFAGSWTFAAYMGSTWYGTAGFTDSSPGVNGTFRNPSGLACDAAGNVWVADTGNHAVRRVAPDGTITTVAGNGACALTDGVGTVAQFCAPQGITVAPSGDIVVADTNNIAIRRIRVTGSDAEPIYTVSTVITTVGPLQNMPNSVINLGAVQVDNVGNIYTVVSSGNRLLMWSPTSPGAMSYVAGTGQPYDSNAATPQPAISDVSTFRLTSPVALALAPDGTLYTNENMLIRAIGPQATA